jgi:hypothetical protein
MAYVRISKFEYRTIVRYFDVLRTLEHDPEKWKPVFRKDHAPLKNRSADRFKSKMKLPAYREQVAEEL